MIAITGANGLLGSFLVRRLLKENESFIALKREKSDLSLLEDIRDRVQWRDVDILNIVSLTEALKDVTRVIHAAALVSFNPRSSSVIYKVNVEGTRNVVNACLANGIKKLVHISSVAALGRVKGQEVIDEDHQWTENSMNSTYAESKYLAELEVFRGQEEGLDTVTLNPSVILAPADWAKSSARLFKYVWKENLFYIDSRFNYVDVRDVAEAAFTLLQSNYSGERFIVNAGAVKLVDFFSKTAARLCKKPPHIRLNALLLQSAAFAESLRSWITRSEPLITKETARLAGADFSYNNEKIKKRLHFQFQSIDHTLDWCCAHYLTKAGRKK